YTRVRGTTTKRGSSWNTITGGGGAPIVMLIGTEAVAGPVAATRPAQAETASARHAMRNLMSVPSFRTGARPAPRRFDEQAPCRGGGPSPGRPRPAAAARRATPG